MTTMMTRAVREIDGKAYVHDAKGRLVPVEVVPPMDALIDQTVATIIGHAKTLSAQIGRFKAHCNVDVEALRDLLADRYGTAPGGAKGNMTLTSFDGLLKVQLQVADRFEFGPELDAAKSLIDACLRDWSADSRPELRALVDRVFAVDGQGTIDRAALFSLIRLDIDDERWRRAVAAIRDAIRVVGSKAYLRFYERDAPDGAWRSIPIDLAAV